MKIWTMALLAALFVQPVFAEESKSQKYTVASIGNTPSDGTISAVSSTSAAWTELIVGGVKSWNSGQRPSDTNKRQFKSKNEFFLGAKTKSGWGVHATFVEQAGRYEDSKRNYFSPQDPSLAFSHPIYEGADYKLSGQYKEYFPVSDNSKKKNQHLHTYYLNLNAKLKGGIDLFNQLTPRYFDQKNYLPTDTTFYTEDYTFLSKNMSSSLRLGIGQHAQLEYHNGTVPGTTIEIFPYADLMLTKTIFAGPRIYMPVFVQNSVYDAPKSVSTNDMLAEFYLQATL